MLVIVMYSIDVLVDLFCEVDYDDVVEDVIDELIELVLFVEKVGILWWNFIVDFGFGFGKLKVENFEFFGCIDEFVVFGCLIFVGYFYKLMFLFVGEEFGDNFVVIVVGMVIVVDCGVDIVCVYDVLENVVVVNVVFVFWDLNWFEVDVECED